MKSASIIVPIWGAPELTDACLRALEETTEDYELILIDNTGIYEPQSFYTTIIHNAENVGYARANNDGVAIATSPICVLLNCDTETQEEWLPPLLSAFDDESVHITGPRIIHMDGTLQTSGCRTWHGNGSAGGEELKDDGPTRDVDAVTGAVMAIRRETYHALGGMNELFRAGYEDIFICLCAREANMTIRYVAESLVKHHESATPGRWTHAAANVQLMNELWGNR